MGLVGAGLAPLLPFGLPNSLAYLAIAGVGLFMSVQGARLARSGRRRVWVTIAAGQTAYFLGDVLWVVFESVLHIDPFPSVADLAYLSWYPMMALGLAFLAREQYRAGRAALLDAAIISTGLAVLITEFVVIPVAFDGGGELLSQLVAASYPAGDLLMLSVLIGVFTSGAGRGFSFWALVTGLGVFLAADIQYVLVIAAGDDLSLWLDTLWLAGYLVVGFAALHPSSNRVTEPSPSREARFTALRLAFLGLALGLSPVTEALRHLTGRDGISPVVLVGGALSIALVLARMWDLLQTLHRQSRQLEALARSDSLTGVANRRTWDHELARSLDAAGRHRMPLVVAMIDLDHFKRFNDTHGHVLGDLVLKEAAAGWSEMLEERGFLARYGGEEFTVILPDVGIEQAAAELDELRRATPHEQTCSIGFALWDGEESVDELVSRADQALYHAKRHGRNQIAVHDGQQTRDAGRRDADPALTACAE